MTANFRKAFRRYSVIAAATTLLLSTALATSPALAGDFERDIALGAGLGIIGGAIVSDGDAGAIVGGAVAGALIGGSLSDSRHHRRRDRRQYVNDYRPVGGGVNHYYESGSYDDGDGYVEWESRARYREHAPRYRHYSRYGRRDVSGYDYGRYD